LAFWGDSPKIRATGTSEEGAVMDEELHEEEGLTYHKTTEDAWFDDVVQYDSAAAYAKRHKQHLYDGYTGGDDLPCKAPTLLEPLDEEEGPEFVDPSLD